MQEFSRNTGTTVKHEGSIGYFVTDFSEALKIDPHRTLIETVCSADGNGERIHIGFFNEPGRVFVKRWASAVIVSTPVITALLLDERTSPAGRH